MKIKIALSMLVILFVIAASFGATMAWFTDSEELTNTFTAGRLSISGVDEWKVTTFDQEETDVWDNANPGECQEKEFEITNDGTKKVYIRFNFDGAWTNLPNENHDDPKNDPFPDHDLVTITPAEGFEDNWSELELNGDIYWYYNGLVDPEETLTFSFRVCLDGPDTTNHYQEATYEIEFNFEAVQATHYASFDLWNAGYYEGDAWYEVIGSLEDGFTMSENSGAGTWDPTGAGEPNYLGWN